MKKNEKVQLILNVIALIEENDNKFKSLREGFREINTFFRNSSFPNYEITIGMYEMGWLENTKTLYIRVPGSTTLELLGFTGLAFGSEYQIWRTATKKNTLQAAKLLHEFLDNLQEHLVKEQKNLEPALENVNEFVGLIRKMNTD